MIVMNESTILPLMIMHGCEQESKVDHERIQISKVYSNKRYFTNLFRDGPYVISFKSAAPAEISHTKVVGIPC